MLQALNLRTSPPILALSFSVSDDPTCSALPLLRPRNPTHNWALLLSNLKCNGRFSCLFSNNRREVLCFSSLYLFQPSTDYNLQLVRFPILFVFNNLVNFLRLILSGPIFSTFSRKDKWVAKLYAMDLRSVAYFLGANLRTYGRTTEVG